MVDFPHTFWSFESASNWQDIIDWTRIEQYDLSKDESHIDNRKQSCEKKFYSFSKTKLSLFDNKICNN